MTDQKAEQVLVLRDGEGNIYLFPHHIVEKARVPVEQRAEIEEELNGGDVSGFNFDRTVFNPTSLTTPGRVTEPRSGHMISYAIWAYPGASPSGNYAIGRVLENIWRDGI